MGVVDLLPHCMSGVYFIYHQDYEKWSFGKLSVLQEASLALEGGYQYYYMGYYIHSCLKMRYKGDYKPQYVLNPETYEWRPLEEVKPLLDTHVYVSFSHKPRTELSLIQAKDEEPDTFGTPAEAASAVEAGLSLFAVKMPGVMTLEELLEEVDLDRINLTFGSTPGRLAQMEVGGLL